MWKLICLILISSFCLSGCNPLLDQLILCNPICAVCYAAMLTAVPESILVEFHLLNQSTYDRYCQIFATAKQCINNRNSNCTILRRQSDIILSYTDPTYTCSRAGQTAIRSLASSACANNCFKQHTATVSLGFCSTAFFPLSDNMREYAVANNNRTAKRQLCRFQRGFDTCRIEAATEGCGPAYGQMFNATLALYNRDKNDDILNYCNINEAL